MKVNIGGKGSIPGLGVLAPAYGVEMDKVGVRRLLNFNTFRVYQSSTGLLITTANIDEMFKNTIKTAAVAVKPVEKKPVTQEAASLVENAILIGIDVAKKAIVEETTVEVEETPLPEITDENINVEKFQEMAEPVVDTTTVDTVSETIAETVNEDTNEKPNNNRQEFNRRKNRNRHH